MFLRREVLEGEKEIRIFDRMVYFIELMSLGFYLFFGIYFYNLLM